MAKRLSKELIEELERTSMIHQAAALQDQVRAHDKLFLDPYAKPQSPTLTECASVWLSPYGCATLCRDGQSTLQAFADAELWGWLQKLGVTGMHTGPMLKAGGIRIQDDKIANSATVDGWFDPISLEIDTVFGTADQYRELTEVARRHGASVHGDSVPGHTGKGADFQLAIHYYRMFPGLYVMISVDPKHWGELPVFEPGEDPTETKTLTESQVKRLKDLGIILGSPRAMSDTAGTCWDCTGVMTDVDGQERRTLYLHFFDRGQPTLNWIDASFGAWRIVIAQITYLIYVLGVTAVRLDANAFLGLEGTDATQRPWAEAHPLSESATNMMAWQCHRLGGFTFQELNAAFEHIRDFCQWGPDLAYDFMTRPAVEHALLMRNADLLRLMYQEMRRCDIEPARLIHALGNHDDITYELPHLVAHAADPMKLGRKTLTGHAIRERTRREMALKATSAAPYNRISGNGLCTTLAGLIAAALGYPEIHRLPDAQKARLTQEVRQGHLLLSAFNALQPGVLAVTGWDLTGALPLEEVPEQFLHPGGQQAEDKRWYNRGAYDLVGIREASASPMGIPVAEQLYGTLPQQFADENSFVSRLGVILAKRDALKIQSGQFCGVLDLADPALFGMVTLLENRKDGRPHLAITLLNFSREERTIDVTLDVWSSEWLAAAQVQGSGTFTFRDAFTGADLDDGTGVVLEGWGYRLLEV